MSDMVEDVRRLERIAREYALTKQDIVGAARQLARAILTLCGGQGPVQIAWEKKLLHSTLPTSGELQSTGFPNYWIENGRLMRETPDLRAAEARAKYVAVDENRDVALLFADDIAKGLLGHIYQNLGEQNAKAKLALSVLKTASKILTREGSLR